jgi:hypothetical protein
LVFDYNLLPRKEWSLLKLSPFDLWIVIIRTAFFLLWRNTEFLRFIPEIQKNQQFQPGFARLAQELYQENIAHTLRRLGKLCDKKFITISTASYNDFFRMFWNESEISKLVSQFSKSTSFYVPFLEQWNHEPLICLALALM